MSGVATLLSIVLATGAMGPATDVVVDVEVYGEDGERRPVLEQRFRDDIVAALGDEGITAIDEEARGHVLVNVRQPDIIDYEVSIKVEVDGALVEPGVTPFSCNSCRLADLQGKIAERVPQIVTALELPTAPEPEPTDDPRDPPAEEDTEPAEPEASTPPTTKDNPKGRTIGALGYAGIAVAAFGLGGLTYGAVLASRDPTTMPNGRDERHIRGESFDRPAQIWLGVGIGGAIAGAAMVVVDLTVLRRRRQQHVAMHPWTGPRSAGATMRIRF